MVGDEAAQLILCMLANDNLSSNLFVSPFAIFLTLLVRPNLVWLCCPNNGWG